jgi:hypothetical protein
MEAKDGLLSAARLSICEKQENIVNGPRCASCALYLPDLRHHPSLLITSLVDTVCSS